MQQNNFQESRPIHLAGSLVCTLSCTVSSEMGQPCSLAANLGPITDVEVVRALERRGADKDWARKKQVPSERQVYAALKQRHPQETTTAQLSNLLADLQALGLTRGEQLQIANLKPTAPVVVHLIVEDCESRLAAAQVDALLASVEQNLR